jgi:hypothetical protein
LHRPRIEFSFREFPFPRQSSMWDLKLLLMILVYFKRAIQQLIKGRFFSLKVTESFGGKNKKSIFTSFLTVSTNCFRLRLSRNAKQIFYPSLPLLIDKCWKETFSFHPSKRTWLRCTLRSCQRFIFSPKKTFSIQKFFSRNSVSQSILSKKELYWTRFNYSLRMGCRRDN